MVRWGKKSHRTGATRSLKERGGYFTGDGVGSKGRAEQMNLSSRQNSLDGQKG